MFLTVEVGAGEQFERHDGVLDGGLSRRWFFASHLGEQRCSDATILAVASVRHYGAKTANPVGVSNRELLADHAAHGDAENVRAGDAESVEETGSVVESLGELKYSKNTSKPIRMVVAVAGDSTAESVKDLPNGVRVQTEYLESTRRFFEQNGVEANIRLSYGATEAKIPDIADCVVEITETGRALRAAGLKVIDTILTSYTEVVANPVAYADPEKRKAMDQVMTLLNGVLDARGRVLLKLNVDEEHRDAVLAVLPSMKSPTVSPLSDGGYAVESVIEKRTVNLVIPALREAGATDLLEMPISKIVP